MPLFLFYLPLLFSPIYLQTSQIYTWQPYGLSVMAPVNLEETKDEDYWEIEDENLDFWWDAERMPFSDVEEEIWKDGAKNGAFRAAELMGYENCKDGGPVPNVPEGHFVISNDEEYDVYYIVILDRIQKVSYEIILEAHPKFKPQVMQAINSLRFN